MPFKMYENQLPEASGVYCIINTLNGKRYIGFSTNIRRRVREHFSRLSSRNPKYYYPGHKDFINDWNISNNYFSVEILELTEDKSQEEYWIRYYKSYIKEHGYNISIGTRISEQAKEKLRGHPATKGFSGRKHTDETIQKMIQSRTGLKRNEETKAKMRESACKVWEHRSKEEARLKVIGSKNPRAKLNESKVKAIKKLLKLGFSCKDIADMYEVHETTIKDIKFCKHWKHVEL